MTQYSTPRMPSNMSHHFAQVPQLMRPRSSFTSPYEFHTAHNAKFIYPFFMLEVLPGDTIKFDGRAISRLITPLKPFMSNLYIDFHFFHSPNRLDWVNWAKFMGERDDPDSSIDYIMPQMYLPASTGWLEDSLQDYLNYGCPGVPGNGTATYSVHNLFGRMYNNVWNKFYRNQNYQDSVVHDTGNGPDNVANYVLLSRNKRADYFTSLLPEPQKGTAAPLIIGGNVPVITDGTPPVFVGNTPGWSSTIQVTNTAQKYVYWTTQPTGADTAEFGSNTGLQVDLDAMVGNTINDFRLSAVVQQFLELDSRGGTRDVEQILSHWGVVVPDFRIQRPELIGAGTLIMNMVSVPQTSETLDASNTPQGNLAAYALFNGKIGFTHSFVEHGKVLGLLSVRSDLSYQRGVPRMYSRRTRFDFYDPLFANLGEQAVLGKELSLQGLAGGAADQRVIGYQEYAGEMRYINSVITGAMRSTHSQSLDVWHLAQELPADQDIDDQFMVDDPPIDRVTAVEDFQFQTNVYADVRMARIMPMYSVPGLTRI